MPPDERKNLRHPLASGSMSCSPIHRDALRLSLIGEYRIALTLSWKIERKTELDCRVSSYRGHIMKKIIAILCLP